MSLAVITDWMGDDVSLERDLLERKGIDVFVAATAAPESWLDAAEQADAILTRHAPLDLAAIARLQRCRIIARYGTGHDNVDVGAAAERGIVVTNVPGYCTEEVADHAMALLLATARGIPHYSRAVREGGWTPRPLPKVQRLRGRRLALLGCGLIGAAVTGRAQAFGLEVTAYDPHAAQLPDGVRRAASVAELVAGADVLSLHAPLTEATRHAIGAAELAALEPGAIVVNVARGGLLDVDAALSALDSGQLGGLALDVLEEEPPASDHALRSATGALVTPHVGYYSTASVAEAKRRSVAELVGVLAGASPSHPVAIPAGAAQ